MALWCCHRQTCGNTGAMRLDGQFAPYEVALASSKAAAAASASGGAAQSIEQHMRTWQLQEQREVRWPGGMWGCEGAQQGRANGGEGGSRHRICWQL